VVKEKRSVKKKAKPKKKKFEKTPHHQTKNKEKEKSKKKETLQSKRAMNGRNSMPGKAGRDDILCFYWRGHCNREEKKKGAGRLHAKGGRAGRDSGPAEETRPGQSDAR